MALTGSITGSLTVGPDRNGRVLAIHDGVIAAEIDPAALVLACSTGEITSGNICAHTHLYSALAPYGMPPASPAPQTFLEILERVWWRLDRALDAESLRAGARAYIAKALLSGTTSLIDHHESPAMIGGSLAILQESCEDLGMRALLCYGASERNFGASEARAGLEECRTVRASSLVRGLVGLHASFTVSDDTIARAGALARDLDTILHVHVAEDRADVEDAVARGYDGPLERLEKLDALPAGSILAHGVHLSERQVRRAEDLGLWLVQNPRSNEGNRVGYAGNLAASRHVALGTDGWPADMAAEEAALHRLADLHGDRQARHRLAMGHHIIAERFGFGATGLTPGAAGDIVVREGSRILHVVIAGNIVVRDGTLVTGDSETIEAEARAAAAPLWGRLADL